MLMETPHINMDGADLPKAGKISYGCLLFANGQKVTWQPSAMLPPFSHQNINFTHTQTYTRTHIIYVCGGCTVSQNLEGQVKGTVKFTL